MYPASWSCRTCGSAMTRSVSLLSSSIRPPARPHRSRLDMYAPSTRTKPPEKDRVFSDPTRLVRFQGAPPPAADTTFPGATGIPQSPHPRDDTAHYSVDQRKRHQRLAWPVPLLPFRRGEPPGWFWGAGNGRGGSSHSLDYTVGGGLGRHVGDERYGRGGDLHRAGVDHRSIRFRSSGTRRYRLAILRAG